MLVAGSKCVFAGGEHGPCSGRIQWHHVYPKARLKKQFKYGARRAFSNGEWKAASRTLPVTPESRAKWPFTELTLDEIIADPRNRMWLCAEGHHERVTNGRLHPPVPESVWAFCRDFNLTAQLENDIARAA